MQTVKWNFDPGAVLFDQLSTTKNKELRLVRQIVRLKYIRHVNLQIIELRRSINLMKLIYQNN